MCIECGCGQAAPTQIDGQPAESVHSPLLNGAPPPPHHLHSHEHEHDHVHPHDHSHPPEESPLPGVAHSHPHSHSHTHEHPHDHNHSGDADDPGHPHPPAHHTHADAGRRILDVHQAILGANDRQAERNRGFFRALRLLVVNVLSSPGSGKTELILQTIERLKQRLRTGVVVGDVATDNDARRLRATGAPVVQITTGTLCHLDAEMVARAMGRLDPRALDLLFLENVGNLVCPAAFDLGEDFRVALLSVTEGEDKPLKYPPLFLSARAVVISKIDLAEAAQFQRALALENVGRTSPAARIFELSARSGTGLEAWCNFLIEQHSALSAGRGNAL